MTTPVFTKSRSGYKMSVEAQNLERTVTVHTLWHDIASVSERVMPLHEALQFVADWGGSADVKAITIY